MPRNRMIKPDFWDDEKLSTISRDARLTFIGLWTHSDDVGISKGNLKWLKNKIFPYDELEIDQFEKWICELIDLKVIMPYNINQEIFIHIKNFNKHQKINKPSVFKNPAPNQAEMQEYYGKSKRILQEYTRNSTKLLQEHSGSNEGELLPENKLNEVKENEVKKEFDKFWELYDKKIGNKEKIFKIFKKLNADDKKDIFSNLTDYIKSTPEKQFRKNPQKYLTEESWKDEIIQKNDINKPKTDLEPEKF